MKTRIKVILFIFIIANLDIIANNITIKEDFYNIDRNKKLILINEDIASCSTEVSTITLGDTSYSCSSVIRQLQIGKQYSVSSSTNVKYLLYFTQLPIVTITTQNTIVDEPRVCAKFSMSEINKEIITSNIGIEYRGKTAQSYPKKSFRIEFWNDTIGDNTKNYSLLGMRNDDDWNLQAMYNEPLRIRSKTNFKLWQMIDTLYYKKDEPAAINGVKQEYVELFLNGKYCGVYTLSERVDKKQLKLKKTNGDGIRGELYKGIGWGASTYSYLKSYTNTSKLWSGFQLEYPNNTICWNTISDFVGFVVNSDSSEFYNNYQNYFFIDNAVNYYIFMNLIHARDNTGKNLFVAKYNKDNPYFYIPWDLDGSLGMWWNGSKDSVTNNILSNGFYDKLVIDYQADGFVDKLNQRWSDLRKDIITNDKLMQMLNANFSYLKDNAVYEREALVWSECQFLDTTNLIYTSTWIEDRITYLDKVFYKTNFILGEEEQTANDCKIKIYPNPAKTFIVFDISSNITANFKIINMQKITVKQGRIQGKHQINISSLQKGIYLVIVTINAENHIQQLVIQ